MLQAINGWMNKQEMIIDKSFVFIVLWMMMFWGCEDKKESVRTKSITIHEKEQAAGEAGTTVDSVKTYVDHGFSGNYSRTYEHKGTYWDLPETHDPVHRSEESHQVVAPGVTLKNKKELDKEHEVYSESKTFSVGGNAFQFNMEMEKEYKW